MKRITVLLLVLLMAFCVCACTKTEETQPATETAAVPTVPVTEAPTEAPEPQWEPATVRVEGSRILWKTFGRGAEITVLGALDDWYIIEGEDADLLISQDFVRLSTEPAFEPRTGYARWGAKLYSRPSLDGEEGITLLTNAKLDVLEGKDDWLYVSCKQGSGYVAKDKVSDYYINSGRSSDDDGGSGDGGGNSSDSGGSGDGGGSSSDSGGNSGGSGSSGGENYGADGGDIPLFHQADGTVGVHLLGIWHGPAYTSMEKVSATVLCEDTEAYLCVFHRGDQVRVTEKGEDECTLLVGELQAKIPRWQLRFADEEAYEAWQGFARRNTALYEDHGLEKELKSFSGNEKLLILDEFEAFKVYAVEYNGQTGFMAFEDVSEMQIYNRSSGGSSSDGGGSSSGGNTSGSGSSSDGGNTSGGGNSTGSGSSNGEWSQPKL